MIIGVTRVKATVKYWPGGNSLQSISRRAISHVTRKKLGVRNEMRGDEDEKERQKEGLSKS